MKVLPSYKGYEVRLETGRGEIVAGDIVKINPHNNKAYGKHIQGAVIGVAINTTRHRNSLINVLVQGLMRIKNELKPGEIWEEKGIAVDENTVAFGFWGSERGE
jgi:hypothetical protein